MSGILKSRPRSETFTNIDQVTAHSSIKRRAVQSHCSVLAEFHATVPGLDDEAFRFQVTENSLVKCHSNDSTPFEITPLLSVIHAEPEVTIPALSLVTVRIPEEWHTKLLGQTSASAKGSTSSVRMNAAASTWQKFKSSSNKPKKVKDKLKGQDIETMDEEVEEEEQISVPEEGFVHKGWIEKKGGSSGKGRHNWKRRFCIMQNHELRFYAAESDAEEGMLPKKVVPLMNARWIPMTHKRGGFALSIPSLGDTEFHMRLLDPIEFKHWRQLIKSTLQFLNGEPDGNFEGEDEEADDLVDQTIQNMDDVIAEYKKPGFIAFKGWLLKKGGRSGGRRNWKRRWALLRDGYLDFFEDQDSRIPKSSFYVCGSEVIEQTEKYCGFGLQKQGQPTFQLATEKGFERQQWCKVLGFIAQIDFPQRTEKISESSTVMLSQVLFWSSEFRDMFEFTLQNQLRQVWHETCTANMFLEIGSKSNPERFLCSLPTTTETKNKRVFLVLSDRILYCADIDVFERSVQKKWLIDARAIHSIAVDQEKAPVVTLRINFSMSQATKFRPKHPHPTKDFFIVHSVTETVALQFASQLVSCVYQHRQVLLPIMPGQSLSRHTPQHEANSKSPPPQVSQSQSPTPNESLSGAHRPSSSHKSKPPPGIGSPSLKSTQPKLVRSGHFWKKGTGAFALWKKRYFELTTSTLYFKDSQDAQMDFKPLSLQKVVLEPKKGVEKGGKYCLDIVPSDGKGRRWRLAFDQEVERKDWSEDIQAAIVNANQDMQNSARGLQLSEAC